MQQCYDWQSNVLKFTDVNGNKYNLKFRGNKTIVHGDSATGKSLLCTMLKSYINDNNNASFKPYNADNIFIVSKDNKDKLPLQKGKLIIIDRGDNRYLIFLRKPMGIELSPNYFGTLCKKDGELQLEYECYIRGWA